MPFASFPSTWSAPSPAPSALRIATPAPPPHLPPNLSPPPTCSASSPAPSALRGPHLQPPVTAPFARPPLLGSRPDYWLRVGSPLLGSSPGMPASAPLFRGRSQRRTPAPPPPARLQQALHKGRPRAQPRPPPSPQIHSLSHGGRSAPAARAGSTGLASGPRPRPRKRRPGSESARGTQDWRSGSREPGS